MAQIQTLRLNPAEEALAGQLEAAGAAEEAARLRASGLPTRRVEAYHYTDLRVLLREVPPPAGPAAEAGPPALRIPGAYRLLTVNGVPQAATGTAPAGVIVGTDAGPGPAGGDDPVARLNSSLRPDGGFDVVLEGSVDPVLHLDNRITGEAGHAVSSARLLIGDGASATVVETFSGTDAAHLLNHASHVTLGRDARLTHILVDLGAPASRHFATAAYALGEGARLRSLVIHAGSSLARTQVFGRIEGEGSHADFTGLNLAGDGQHLDITLDLTHAVPDTTSTELFKAVARGRSKAVFQGRILVARDAQKTDAKMMSQGLMLSDEAEILVKPELEIYADDVVCGHGATCGDLDGDALFYLMSRGIPRAEAETVLIRAFLAELLDPIEDTELNEALQALVDGWLAGAG